MTQTRNSTKKGSQSTSEAHKYSRNLTYQSEDGQRTGTAPQASHLKDSLPIRTRAAAPSRSARLSETKALTDHKTPVPCIFSNCVATETHQHPLSIQFYDPRPEDTNAGNTDKGSPETVEVQQCPTAAAHAAVPKQEDWGDKGNAHGNPYLSPEEPATPKALITQGQAASPGTTKHARNQAVHSEEKATESPYQDDLSFDLPARYRMDGIPDINTMDLKEWNRQFYLWEIQNYYEHDVECQNSIGMKFEEF
ncbi:hypothetical protein ACLMJK_004251 [Lecanora helva]